MPVLDEDWCGAGSDSGRQRCSCLPFCFWGTKSPDAAAAKRRRRRRRRLRLSIRLSWLAWPWFFIRKQKGGGKQKDGESKGKKNRRSGRRLLLLLTASLQPKKALASVVSGDSALLPATKVSSYGDAKKQSNRKPRTTTVDGAASGSSRQPQAPAASTRWIITSTATAARSRPETSQPSPRQITDGPAIAAGRTWRAPSRRHSFHHHHQIDSTGGLWTAAATLGVIVLLGRVTAVAFLCSCLYGARFVRARTAAGGVKKANHSGAGGSSSRRFGEPVAVGVAGEKVVVAAELCATTEERRAKKVVMAGFLDRAGKAPSSRFGR